MSEYEVPKMVHQIIRDSGAPANSSMHPLVAQFLEGSRPVINSPRNGGQVEIQSKGQVDKISFPKGWSAGYSEPYKGIGHRSYDEVQLNGDKEVAVSFYYRGFPLKDEAQGKAFHDLILAAPHTVSGAELKSIAEVLGDKANPSGFNTLSARTQTLNGKSVLVVEGRYKALQQDAYHIFVDADGTGKNIQEIFYQAPKAKYFSHLKEAKSAFDSIKWK